MKTTIDVTIENINNSKNDDKNNPLALAISHAWGISIITAFTGFDVLSVFREDNQKYGYALAILPYECYEFIYKYNKSEEVYPFSFELAHHNISKAKP